MVEHTFHARRRSTPILPFSPLPATRSTTRDLLDGARPDKQQDQNSAMYRAYQAPALAPQRHPLTNAAHAVNNAGPIPGSPPPKQAQKPRAPSSPPLPRQNTKTTPPSPPQVIKDRGRSIEFLRIALLGEVCTYSALAENPTNVYQRAGLLAYMRLRMLVVRD